MNEHISNRRMQLVIVGYSTLSLLDTGNISTALSTLLILYKSNHDIFLKLLNMRRKSAFLKIIGFKL